MTFSDSATQQTLHTDVSAWDFKWVKQLFTWEVYGIIHKTVNKLRKLWFIALHVLESSSCSAAKYLITANPVHKGYTAKFFIWVSAWPAVVSISLFCSLVLTEWENKLVSLFRSCCLLHFQPSRVTVHGKYERNSRDPLWTEKSQMNQSPTQKQWCRERRTGRERWSFNSISDWFTRLLGWWCSLSSFF